MQYSFCMSNLCFPEEMWTYSARMSTNARTFTRTFTRKLSSERSFVTIAVGFKLGQSDRDRGHDRDHYHAYAHDHAPCASAALAQACSNLLEAQQLLPQSHPK